MLKLIIETKWLLVRDVKISINLTIQCHERTLACHFSYSCTSFFVNETWFLFYTLRQGKYIIIIDIATIGLSFFLFWEKNSNKIYKIPNDNSWTYLCIYQSGFYHYALPITLMTNSFQYSKVWFSDYY